MSYIFVVLELLQVFLTWAVPLAATREIAVFPAHPERIVTVYAIVGDPGLHQPVARCCSTLLSRTVERSHVGHHEYLQ